MIKRSSTFELRELKDCLQLILTGRHSRHGQKKEEEESHKRLVWAKPLGWLLKNNHKVEVLEAPDYMLSLSLFFP